MILLAYCKLSPRSLLAFQHHALIPLSVDPCDAQHPLDYHGALPGSHWPRFHHYPILDIQVCLCTSTYILQFKH